MFIQLPTRKTDFYPRMHNDLFSGKKESTSRGKTAAAPVVGFVRCGIVISLNNGYVHM